MSFYTEMQDVAAELLTEFGMPSTLTKSGATVSDPSKGWENSAQASDITEEVIVAVVPVTDRKDVKLLEGLGAFSKSGNILVAAKDMVNEVLPNDFITHGEDKWKIVSAVPVKPATITVMYNCIGII